jgi:O-antigen/teichoic acid export membrane protein
VPAYGLIGLAYSQVLQAFLFLLSNWLFLKWHMPILPLIPIRWEKKLFKEILSYGLNLQVISICDMLLDPMTKAFAAKFGGLAMTGYYDLASRMLLHLREFINQANRTLIPALADLHENNPDHIVEIYKDSYKLNFFIIVPFFFLAIACAPLISQLWLGRYEHHLILFFIIIAFGWLINMISMPAQIVYIATGKLMWITIASIVMVISGFMMGILLGFFYGGTGAVISWSLSRIIGSIIIIIAYHFKNHDLFRQLQRDNIYIVIAAIIFICVFPFILAFLHDLQLTPIQISGITIMIYTGVMCLPLWKHPIRKRLVNYMGSNFVNVRFKP